MLYRLRGGANSGVASSIVGINVLVVDDERELCRLLEISLTRSDCRVHVAQSDPEALEILAAEPVDVVLLDVLMPGMDGFAVCMELRSGQAQLAGTSAGGDPVSIVLLTALSRPDDIVKGFRLGADDYILKPFTFKEVVVRLQAIARSRGWAADHPEGLGEGSADRAVVGPQVEVRASSAHPSLELQCRRR